MIRVVLVDDQALVRAGLRSLAEHDGDITVVGEAASGPAGVQAVRETHPDVVLLDIRMPDGDGLAAARTIVADRALGQVRVAMLTTFDADQDVHEAIRIGASGYLLKDIGPDDLRQAIRSLAAGDRQLSPSVTAQVMAIVAATCTRPDLVQHLSDREREVLTRIALGDSNDEIGRELSISPATARTYVGRLLHKLHARDRVRLVVIGYEAGLVRPGQR